MMEKDQGFRALDENTMIEYIKATPALAAKLGNQLEGVKIKEIGGGNVNFVYTVIGDNGSFVIKQALPYMRCLGESYPFPRERAYFETLALKEYGRLCPDHVPEVYHFDRNMSLIAMRYLEPPHIVLREGLIAGIEYPLLAEHMSEYLAKTLYFTSLLFRSTSEHKRSVAEFIGNIEPCSMMAQYYFSESFKDSDGCISWTSPYLDNDVKALHQDDDLKLEIAKLKSIFCERAQALIHGDLHTSAVMVTKDSTQIIDLEMAFYGPMGFDIGTFVAHLLIAFFAQDGLANQENDRKKYKQWILRTIEETWNLFEKKFISLWNEHKDGNGEAYLSTVYNTPELQNLVQKNYMKDLLQDSLGFCAAKLIRGTTTVAAPLEDFESITDASRRACCERHALNLGKLLLKGRHQFESIGQVIAAVKIFPQSDSCM